MNAAAIVYTSQTGFTARYAALLAERTGLPCRPLKEAAALPRGTAVIYLGWLCAGGIKGLKGARRRFRTAAVCAVGMSPVDNLSAVEAGLSGAPLFYLRGGYDGSRLTGPYKLVMDLLGKAMEKRLEEDPEDGTARAMTEAIRHGADWVSREQLRPVLTAWEGRA